MEGLRQYVISVVAAGIICGILTHITSGSAGRQVAGILCGLFMTIVLLQPLASVGEINWEPLLDNWEQQGEVFASEGVDAVADRKAELIKQQAEAYILDKAAAMHAAVEADITVGADGIPVSVRISGAVSPLVKSRLTDILTSELGIPKENQQWTG